MINRTAQQVLFRCSRVSFAGFSGKKHPPPYDWRDDHDMNPSFERDPRRIGCEDPTLYSYPYEGVQKEMPDLYPKEYDPKDLTKNFVGTYPMQPLEVTNLMEAPMQVLMDDIAHEREYGS